MSIDLLFTTGSGDRTGAHGPLRGIGGIIRVGGMYTVAGHMTGIGITAMLSTTTTTIVLSVRDARFTAVTMSYNPA